MTADVLIAMLASGLTALAGIVAGVALGRAYARRHLYPEWPKRPRRRR